MNRADASDMQPSLSDFFSNRASIEKWHERHCHLDGDGLFQDSNGQRQRSENTEEKRNCLSLSELACYEASK